ncbi:hypothetical protein [Plantactinospora sp. CA-290183]|uniref:hypothetical protein n=1 Tax=Plantactinospora sp. CA-290183 TaxID=3240006 RepID=UPI003D94B027
MRAAATARDRLGPQAGGRVVAGLPMVFVETTEVSPPGWSREVSAPPTPSLSLPATSELRSWDRIAVAKFVVVIADSLFDHDAQDVAFHNGDDYILDPAISGAGDPDLDWDQALIGALTTIGLEPVGMPDWLWFRSSWSDE